MNMEMDAEALEFQCVTLLSEFPSRHNRGLNELFPGVMEWGQSLHGQRASFIWFTKSQLQSVIRNGVVPEWFHGIISRKTSEDLLMSKPPGYFLIRVSESRIGYTLSYRAGDRCRHFMIDALEDGQYIIVGENKCHRFLQDLVDFHRRTPIVPYTEVLTVACGQASNDKSDYAELLFPRRHLNPDTSLPPDHVLLPSVSQPASAEDVPPALPYRPNNLTHSAVLTPNRLYPSLEEGYPHVTSPISATPVPMNRTKYKADNPPSDRPPEVPARPAVPPLKQNQACIRTVSAPDSPAPLSAIEHPLGANIQSVKNQEAKQSVVTNLKNLKKKFHKKRSMSQELMYTEIDLKAAGRSGDTESEYLEITNEVTSSGSPFSSTFTDVSLTDEGLPLEYCPPPPFAPGY